MSSRVDAGRRRRRRISLLAACLLPAAGMTGHAAHGAEDEARTPGYCAGVQQYLADTRRVARTVHHETLAAFARSKPEARPLVVHQYLHEDPGGRPKMISCKTKTADALLHAYGALDEPVAAPVASAADAASGRGDAVAPGPAPPQSRRRCRDITLQTLWRVEAQLEALGAWAAARAAREAFAAPNEPYLTGSSYLADFPLVEFVPAAEGARTAAAPAETAGDVVGMHGAANAGAVLRINTRSLRVLWEDRRFRMLPKSLRGVHYCHLAAPDYLRRLLLSRHPPAPGTGP